MMKRSLIELLLIVLFTGGVLGASDSSSESRLTVKGGRFLTLNTVTAPVGQWPVAGVGSWAHRCDPTCGVRSVGSTSSASKRTERSFAGLRGVGRS